MTIAIIVKRTIYKVNSFQFTRLTRLCLAHQDLKDVISYQSSEVGSQIVFIADHILTKDPRHPGSFRTSYIVQRNSIFVSFFRPAGKILYILLILSKISYEAA